jgi:hypothetical protein
VRFQRSISGDCTYLESSIDEVGRKSSPLRASLPLSEQLCDAALLASLCASNGELAPPSEPQGLREGSRLQ